MKLKQSIQNLIITLTTVFFFGTPYSYADEAEEGSGGGISMLDFIPKADGFTDYDYNSGAIPETGMTGIRRIGQVAGGFMSIAALVSFGFFAYHIVQFIHSGDNDKARQKAAKGILISLVGFALFGGLSIILGLLKDII